MVKKTMLGGVLLRSSQLPLLVSIFFIGISSASAAAAFQAKVIHIADGDTITVLNSANEQIKIHFLQHR